MRNLPVGGRGSAAKTGGWLFERGGGPGRGKNSPRRVHFFKGLRTQTVGKARRAGALYGGRGRAGGRRDPEAPGDHGRKAVVGEGREGNREGRCFSVGSSAGEPERSKAQESKGPDPD